MFRSSFVAERNWVTVMFCLSCFICNRPAMSRYSWLTLIGVATNLGLSPWTTTYGLLKAPMISSADSTGSQPASSIRYCRYLTRVRAR